MDALRILVVTAVDAERDAIRSAAPGARVVTGGVGPASSAAAASAELAAEPADLVLSAGIGGGFAPTSVGGIAVAARIAFADLGADSPQGFLTLGVGGESYDVPAKLAVELADRTGGRLGTVLTVATVTGTAERTAQLLERYPDAVAEGMEGAGVAAAAARHGVAVGEIRAVSNVVGPRDRDAWRIPEALEALGAAVAAALRETVPTEERTP